MKLPIARDLMNESIRINTHTAGSLRYTPVQSSPEHVKASLAASVPFPKRFGQPAEYAALAWHLLENGYFNGEAVRLDGAIRMASR